MQLPPPRLPFVLSSDGQAKHLLPPPTLRRTPFKPQERRASPPPPAAPVPRPRSQPLGPGVATTLAGQGFVVTRPLGRGSFGVVWEATDAFGEACALKEIRCRSEADLKGVRAEGRMLEVVRREVSAAGLPLSRVPAFRAMELERGAQQAGKVRLAMSLVPGTALEGFLETRRQELRGETDKMEGQELCAEACLYAGRLLLQLAPILDAFSTQVYHRDITPRNIQIQEGVEGPEFGLVDFGLAVEAPRWRAGEPGAGDLGGDGRYWPVSAWFVFCFGTRALEKDAKLRAEYRTCLDAHSLGLTALRCLVDLLPGRPVSHMVDAPLQRLCAAWKQYWADARKLWQPIFDAFRGAGDFNELRKQFTQAKVHHIVRDDLCAIRKALREVGQACTGLSAETGLAGMPALCDALLIMVQPGGADDGRPTALHAELAMPACRPVRQAADATAKVRQPSQSTASPSSSSSLAMSGDSTFGC